MELMDDIIKTAREVFESEAQALLEAAQHINEEFKSAVELIYSSRGMVIIIGMGKSGDVGRKISSTLTSTGTRSIFLHPGEGIHGDLGIISEKDVCLLISHSGYTEEVARLIPFIRETGAGIISITSDSKSIIAREADISLNTYVTKEACPLNLVPTTSATATLVLGDAIAVALLKKREFDKKDFARLHPGGTLGKKLTLRVEDIMFDNDQLVLAKPSAKIKDVLLEMTDKKQGFTVIVDDEQNILGLITDGDIRRTAAKKPDLFHSECGKIMNPHPFSINKEMLVVDAGTFMRERHIACLLVKEENRIIGAIDIHEIEKAGLKE